MECSGALYFLALSLRLAYNFLPALLDLSAGGSVEIAVSGRKAGVCHYAYKRKVPAGFMSGITITVIIVAVIVYQAEQQGYATHISAPLFCSSSRVESTKGQISLNFFD